MKHFKKIPVPATTREVIDHVSCDLCGATIIESSDYTVNEVEVRHKTGTSCHDGGCGEETSVDMCGKCFEEKLVPWLRSQGAEARAKDWDW